MLQGSASVEMPARGEHHARGGCAPHVMELRVSVGLTASVPKEHVTVATLVSSTSDHVIFLLCVSKFCS